MLNSRALSSTDSSIGHQLVDSLSIQEETLNLLFAALILTALGVFVGGNLFLLNSEVFFRSALILLPCLGLVLIFYALARSLGRPAWGLALTYAVLIGLVYSQLSWAVYFFIYFLYWL